MPNEKISFTTIGSEYYCRSQCSTSGGGHTLNIGLTNTHKFAYIYAYAPYTATEEFQKNFMNYSPDITKINSQLKLFTISVGTDDFLFESVKKNLAMFEEKRIRVKRYIVPDGHNWINAK